MAEVIFMTGVDDVLDYAGRLIRKKYREGACLAVYGPAGLLDQLDADLWCQDPLDFLPHCRSRSGQAVDPAAWATPIWLLDNPLDQTGCTMAVNLGRDDLLLASTHERVAEIIGQDDAGRRAGRLRWKQYEQGGHTLKHVPQDQPDR
jgi:DNA polymerase-3 subunit chi